MSHPTEPRCQRGVYALPFRSTHGHPMLVAVDRRGCYVTHALVFRRDSERDIAAMLERLLDQDDR